MPRSERALRVDWLFDVLAVVSAIALSVSMTTGPTAQLQPHGPMVAGLILLAASLVVRRRWGTALMWIVAIAAVTMVVAAMVAPGTLLRSGMPAQSVVLIPPAAPFAVYSAVVASGSRRLAWPPIAVLALTATAPWDPSSRRIAPGLLLVAGPALLGMYVAARRRLEQALVERAERAEREQHLLAAQARADERARLAAEMHDVVSHRVTAMVLQSGAIRVTAHDETTRAAAEALRATGCQALDELRDLLAVLRDDPDARDSRSGRDGTEQVQPVPDLSALIATSESVGVPATLTTAGSVVAVSPTVGRTAYRIVQEALTNVRKHAPGAHAAVRLEGLSDAVRLTVRSTAGTADPDPALAGRGSGSGLAGLRQRVELVGGALEAAPTADGGFLVTARLPFEVPTRAH